MSYALHKPYRRPRRAPHRSSAVSHLPSYPVYPIPVSGPSTPVKRGINKDILAAVAVVVALLVLMYVLDRFFGEDRVTENKRPQRKRIEKMSTEALARKLYARLDKKGGANPKTMQSLRRISDQG